MASQTNKPVALVVSDSDTKPLVLVNLITNTDSGIDEDFICQPWTLHTKYYTAEIDVCGISNNYPRSANLNERVQAVVIHMDVNKPSALLDLKKYDPIISECDPEIKLLLCDRFGDFSNISKSAAVDWSLCRDFEIIELNPDENDRDEDEQDIIKEKYGIDRVREALGTHIWPNMIRLEDRNNKDDPIEFVDLLSQICSIRESIQTASDSDRKEYAEQMLRKIYDMLGDEDDDDILDI